MRVVFITASSLAWVSTCKLQQSCALGKTECEDPEVVGGESNVSLVICVHAYIPRVIFPCVY